MKNQTTETEKSPYRTFAVKIKFLREGEKIMQFTVKSKRDMQILKLAWENGANQAKMAEIIKTECIKFA